MKPAPLRVLAAITLRLSASARGYSSANLRKPRAGAPQFARIPPGLGFAFLTPASSSESHFTNQFLSCPTHHSFRCEELRLIGIQKLASEGFLDAGADTIAGAAFPGTSFGDGLRLASDIVKELTELLDQTEPSFVEKADSLQQRWQLLGR